MAHLRKLIIGTCAAALMASGVAAKSDITVAMQLNHRIWTRPAPRRGLLILCFIPTFSKA